MVVLYSGHSLGKGPYPSAENAVDVFYSPKRLTLTLTLTLTLVIWWWGSISGALRNVEYFFIAITLMCTY